MNQTVNIAGYTFEVFPPDTTWNDVPGIYMFAGWTLHGWFILYVGQTKSFKDRPGYHEQWRAAVNMGASNVLAMVVHSAQQRTDIEAQLIKSLQPRLNDRLK